MDHGAEKERVENLSFEWKNLTSWIGVYRRDHNGPGKDLIELQQNQTKSPTEEYLAHECGHFLDPLDLRDRNEKNFLRSAYDLLILKGSPALMKMIRYVWPAALALLLAFTLWFSNTTKEPFLVSSLGAFIIAGYVFTLISYLALAKLHDLFPWEKRAKEIAKVLLSNPRWKDVIVEEETKTT